jgi:hypothetical protein
VFLSLLGFGWKMHRGEASQFAVWFNADKMSAFSNTVIIFLYVDRDLSFYVKNNCKYKKKPR